MTQPKYTPGAIVNYFLELAENKGVKLTHLKLQKLLYFSHAWYLAYRGNPLINEPFEAWEYGPVCSSVYHEYKNFGSRPIPSLNLMTEFEVGSLSIKANKVSQDDKDIIGVLNSIWDAYASYDGLTLSSITHHQNPNAQTPNPWKKTIESSHGLKGVDIKNDDIKSYFNELKQLKRKF